MSALRHKFLTMIIAVLAAVHLVCACYTATAAEITVPDMPMTEMSHDGGCGTHNDNNHNDDDRCIHCDATPIFAELQAADTKLDVPASAPSLASRAEEASDTPAAPASQPVTLNRWYDPPPQSPVTLKVRLLN